MRITCLDPSMGYIYLMPPEEEYDDFKSDNNEIFRHVHPEQIKIPFVKDKEVSFYLDLMRIATRTFGVDHEKSFDTEYGIDWDEQGNLIGFELSLNPEQFIDLVKNQAFKVHSTKWREVEYRLITFDHIDEVFKPGNVIYKLTDAEDTFVIVYLKDPNNLGYEYAENEERKPIALFKALLTARDDIYPLEYLLKPEFYLDKNAGLLSKDGVLCSEVDAADYWDALPENERKLLVEFIYCGECSRAGKLISYTVYKEDSQVMLSGKCARCGHMIVSEI